MDPQDIKTNDLNRWDNHILSVPVRIKHYRCTGRYVSDITF